MRQLTIVPVVVKCTCDTCMGGDSEEDCIHNVYGKHIAFCPLHEESVKMASIFAQYIITEHITLDRVHHHYSDMNTTEKQALEFLKKYYGFDPTDKWFREVKELYL